MGDSPADGVRSWSERSSARERVRAVAETLREPRSTNWISDQADAAWGTAREELTAMVEQGRLEQVERGEAMLYRPDYATLLFEEIRHLITTHSREELRSELAAIASQIEEWSATYEVENWQELETSLADPDLESTAITERRDVVERWEETERERGLIRHALSLYDDVTAARDLVMESGNAEGS